MTPPAKLVSRTLVGLFLFLPLCLGLLFLASFRFRQPLPPPPVLSSLPEFTLTNQFGRAFTRSNLLGRVWIADIIFTRCSGPCPMMTRRLAELQRATAGMEAVGLVTLTTDPENDTPAVMKGYGEQYGADFNRWTFLTGAKAQIARLAIDGLKLSAIEQPPDQRQSPEDLFIHSTTFVVVDRQARLRAVVETTGEGVDASAAQNRLVSIARQLLKEP